MPRPNFIGMLGLRPMRDSRTHNTENRLPKRMMKAGLKNWVCEAGIS